MEKMTDDEVNEFLTKGTNTGKISTVRSDGRPHIAPILFIYENGKIFFLTLSTSIKAKNILNNSKVSFCTDDPSPPFSFVIIEGDAKLLSNSNNLFEWAGKIGDRFNAKKESEMMIKRLEGQGMTLVEINPSKIIGIRDVVA